MADRLLVANRGTQLDLCLFPFQFRARNGGKKDQECESENVGFHFSNTNLNIIRDRVTRRTTVRGISSARKLRPARRRSCRSRRARSRYSYPDLSSSESLILSCCSGRGRCR